MALARAFTNCTTLVTAISLLSFPRPTRDSVCRLWVGRGEPADCIGSGRRGVVLWYCGTWVWRGFEQRERPAHPAPVKR